MRTFAAMTFTALAHNRHINSLSYHLQVTSASMDKCRSVGVMHPHSPHPHLAAHAMTSHNEQHIVFWNVGERYGFSQQLSHSRAALYRNYIIALVHSVARARTATTSRHVTSRHRRHVAAGRDATLPLWFRSTVKQLFSAGCRVV